MPGALDTEEAAHQTAGNWQRFDSFVWFRDSGPEDADQWAIVYSRNRDGGLLDQSNAAVIEKALEPFTEGDDPDAVVEQHSHWAVGNVQGHSIRVFDGNGDIAEAFQAYFELQEQLEAYPVLDESDYSQREYDATLENVVDAAWRVKQELALPEGRESQVYSWLSDNDSSEIESRDGQGGYPSEDSLRAAFQALGYKERE